MKNNEIDKASSVATESKVIVKHSLVYGLGNFFTSAIGFIMIPVYTRYLIPSEYGILELVALTTEFFRMIIAMRISRAMYRFYFEYDSIKDKDEVISTAMFSFACIGFIGVMMGFLSSGFLGEKILDSTRYGYYFIISFATLWFGTMAEIAFYYLQILKKATLYIVFSSIRLIIALSFNIYFIVCMKMGVLGMLYGNLIAAVSIFLVLVVPIIIKVGIRFSRKKLSEMLKFGLPLIPGSLANFFVLVSDRYFLKFFTSLADTGIYALSDKFGIIPHRFMTVPFFQIWSVRRFELMKQKQADELMGRIITYFFFVLTFIGLGVSVVSKDTLRIIADPKFWDAHRYIPVLILSYIIYGLFNHFSVNILIQKKTKLLSYIDIINGIINIVLNIILIKSYGIYGAAFATLISYTIRILSLYVVSSHLDTLYFEFGRVGKILLSAVLLFTICTYIELGSPALNLLAKFFTALTFPLVLCILKFYTHNERIKFREAITKRSIKAVWG